MRVHRGKCVASTLRAPFCLQAILWLPKAGSRPAWGPWSPQDELGYLVTFSQNISKLQNKNGARRLDTTHLPRCTRSLTSSLWLIKCLRRVGTVANALFTTSALNSSPSTILCQDFQAGPPDPSSSWKIIDFRRKKMSKFSKIQNCIFRPRAFPPPPPSLNHCFNTLETPPQAPESTF